MRPGSVISVSLALAVLGAAVACGDGVTRECRVGADCASGICSESGACVAAAADPSKPGDVVPPPVTNTGDAGVDPQLPGCVPNFDGTIARAEVPLQAGLKASYVVASDVDVSTAGTTDASGKRTWDFSVATPNDESVIVETLGLTNKWYAPTFAGAAYATKLRASSTLEGIFDTGPAAISLRGVASPDDGLFRTELENDPPVNVLQFPLNVGSAWTDETSVSGLAQGVFSAYSEKYESLVDARGTVKTPLGSFDVLRVRVVLRRTVGFLVTTVRTFAFVSECYGTVASVTSQDDEADLEFTRAIELRRIAP